MKELKNWIKHCQKMPTLLLIILALLSLVISTSFSWPPYNENITPILEGDANGDGIVDIADSTLLALNWQQTVPPADPRADLNGDGIVDVADASIIGANWGKQGSCPYSLDFEFNVPAYSNDQVVYYNDFTMYVPAKLGGEGFYLKGYVDDWVQNVRVDGNQVYQGPSTFGDISIYLGIYSRGYHRLEFDFGEVIGSGSLYVYVSTANIDEKALFTEFYTAVPSNGDNNVQYTVTTHTILPMSDSYYLRGIADDYIDHLRIDSGDWFQDWEWGTLYAWGDGFASPLGYREKSSTPRTVQFDYGEIWDGGYLQFEFLSCSLQADELDASTPTFYAKREILSVTQGLEILNTTTFGGSIWYNDTGRSARFVYANYEFYVHRIGSNQGGKVRLQLGLSFVDSAYEEGETSDFAIMMNLTVLDSGPYTPFDAVTFISHEAFDDLGIYIHVPGQLLNILGLEFTPTGRSTVDPTFKALSDPLKDLGKDLVAFLVYTAMSGGTFGTITGISSAFIFDLVFGASQQEQLPPYRKVQGSTLTDFKIGMDPIGFIAGNANPDQWIFVQLKTLSGTHSGPMEVTIIGFLQFWQYFGGGYVGWNVKLKTTFVVPMFVFPRG